MPVINCGETIKNCWFDPPEWTEKEKEDYKVWLSTTGENHPSRKSPPPWLERRHGVP